MIPVCSTQAEEVANVVRQVYCGGAGGTTGAAPTSPQEFFQQMRVAQGGGLQLHRFQHYAVVHPFA